MRASRPLRPSRRLATAAVVSTVVGTLLAAPSVWAADEPPPAPPSPSGAVALPSVQSAEDFDYLHVLATSDDGLVLERRGPYDWQGNPAPATYAVLDRDGGSRPLPDLEPGYRAGFLDGDVLTTWSDNPDSVVLRRSIASGDPVAGDRSAVPFGASVVAASSEGWVTDLNGMDGQAVRFHRPDGTEVAIDPPGGVVRQTLGADGPDVFVLDTEWGASDGVVRRLDSTTGRLDVVVTTAPRVSSARLTPHFVVWADTAVDPDTQQSRSRVCRVLRSGGDPSCQSIDADWASRLVAADDTTTVWRDTTGRTVSVASVTGSFTPQVVTGAPPGELASSAMPSPFGDRFVIEGSLGRLWVFGADASAAVLARANALPAETFGLALAPGRLVGADNRRVLDDGEIPDWDRDNTYAAWSRSVSRSGSLALGPEQAGALNVRRAGYGSALAASSSRTVQVTRYDRNQSPSCTVTLTDDAGPARNIDVMGCEGSVISGPYYTRELVGPPWYADAVVSVDGRVLQKLAWPTAGTVALFGPRAVWVDADGAAWYRDVETTAAPKMLRAAECGWAAYGNVVSIWGRQALVAPHCADNAYLYDVVTGAVRTLPAMRYPRLTDGAVVWVQPDSTDLMALDLTSSGAAPVRLGEVNPWSTNGDRPRLTVDDDLVAWQDQSSGRVVVAPLPFGQGVAHAPRLLGTVAATSLAAAASGAVSPWHAEFDATKALGSWRLDLRNPSGAVVRTWTGSAPHGGIRLDWDGRIGTRWAPGGRYTWTLSGSAADGEGTLRDVDGAQGALTGTIVVKDAKVRDLGSDRLADLLGVDAKGVLWRWDGTGAGTFKPRAQAGSGWSGLTVSGAGDLTGDGRPDLLARDAAGVLWRYDGTGTGGLRPRVKVATGWNIYTAVVGAGDLTGDGRADVLARDTSGRLWRYDGTGTGGLRPRVSLGTGWNGFTAIVAPGDLTSDGRPDLLVRDAKGNLARYDGNGSGSYRPRVALGAGWNGYSLIVGIGDVTGDGASDLLARDSAGTLWRYAGNGRGGLTPRAVAGSGWLSLARLF